MPSMDDSAPIERVFLGWSSSPLHTAVTELIRRYRRGDALDLGRVLVVLPGRRAGRRLKEHLVDAAERHNLLLTPPDVITESELPELLYQQTQPFASSLIQKLAWAEALRSIDPGERQSLLPHPPAFESIAQWIHLGEIVSRVYRELSAEAVDFHSALQVAERIPGFADRAGWHVLRTVSEAFRSSLESMGLGDPDSSRLAAVRERTVRCEFDIVLIGMVDLNAVVLRMLAQIAERRVTAFVVAPATEAEKFDSFGQLRFDAWQQYPVPIRDEQIEYADDPADQATHAIAWLAGLNGEFAVDQIAIAVPDPAIVPPLRRRLAEMGVRVRWVEERTVADSAPFRLLAAATEYAERGSFAAFARLVRHPDVFDWLAAEGKSIDLSALDDFHSRFLPAAAGRLSHTGSHELKRTLDHLNHWLAGARRANRLADWGKIFSNILKTVYSHRIELDFELEADRVLHSSIRLLMEAIEALRRVPAALDREVPAELAFSLAFHDVAQTPLPPAADPEAIQLLGWLELPLDDAAAVLVTSFNEGFVPTAARADPFLTETLRERLGLEHHGRRYARDAYQATVLVHSKRFACVVGRRDSETNPLFPSRLLFTGPDEEVFARAQQWTKAAQAPATWSAPEPDRPTPFAVPRPVAAIRKSRSFHVTELRTYLACKYRYYLRHVRKLAATNDANRELDGRGFGSMLHDVLADWGNDPNWRNCTDAASLSDNLIERLHAIAGVRFDQGWPAIRLQIAQAARRLNAFSKYQAGLAADGWQPIFVESERDLLTTNFLIGPDDSVSLCGRIDRIDYHSAFNRVRILDYKTADKVTSPADAHRTAQGWIDLQLPLYRHLWRNAVSTEQVPSSASIELGYLHIPRDPQEVKVCVAEDWDDTVLADADKVARHAIRGILQGDFWPPTSPTPAQFEDFAAICLDGLAAPTLDDESRVDE